MTWPTTTYTSQSALQSMSNLTNQPSFYEHQDPEQLIIKFIKDIKARQETIAKKMWEMYPMIDLDSLPKQVFEQWTQWIEQVPVIFFNGGQLWYQHDQETFCQTPG